MGTEVPPTTPRGEFGKRGSSNCFLRWIFGNRGPSKHPPRPPVPPPEDPPTLDGDVQRLAPGRRHPRPAHVLLEPAAEGPAEAPRGLRDEELGGTPRGGPGGVFGAGGALRDLDPVPVEAEAQPGAGPGGQAGTGTGSDGT